MNFQAMRDLMDRLTAWRIPGNSAKIYYEGREVFSYQSGYADLETNEPMTPDHLINIYSCSKPATVTAALQLYEKGFFLLDDPLYTFIPEYRNMAVKCPDGTVKEAEKPITLRHLFTMTSGFNYNRNIPAFEEAKKLTEGKMDTLTVAKCLAKQPLDFEPGSTWRYGLSHDILAAVVEVISGKKFRDYMKENIFEPLGMENTLYHNETVQHRMAQMYRYETGAEADIVTLQTGQIPQLTGSIVKLPKDNSLAFGSEYDSGGAGITSCVSDYVQLCATLANGGMGLTGERILAPGTVELLKTNQLNAQQMVNYNWSWLKGCGYGLGVRTMMDIGQSGTTGPLGEFGWGGAAGASVFVDTQNNLAMFYAHHMHNPQEAYYQPRVRNVLYKCLFD